MAVARARRRSTATKGRGTKAPVGPRPWWGDTGEAPHRRWPGVTIEIPAVWKPLGKLRTRELQDGRTVVVTSAGREVPEWERLEGGRWESPDGRYYFDQEAADRACDFFPTFLRHHIGHFAGQPFELLDYQRCLLTRPIFGWRRTADGLRRFRKVFAFLPKGAGKSPWASGTGLYLTLCDGEPAAEVYALANDKKQAKVVHDNAKVMVEESPELLEEIGGPDNITSDSIYYPATRSAYIVRSSDATGAHGFRPHGIIFDEFHGLKVRELFEALRKSMAKRRQPLLIIVSHAGEDDESLCFEEYEAAKRVLSGTVKEDAFLPVIFEARPEDDWRSPEVWQRVNPGHGITIQHDGIAMEAEEAANEPRKLNDFLRYHLNRWVNQAVSWIPVDWWDACTEPLPDDEVLAAAPCAIGIDMAQKIDLAAAVAVFRLPMPETAEPLKVEVISDLPVEEDDEEASRTRTLSLNYRIAIVPRFWLPEDTLRERVKQDRVPYDVWARQGFVTPTPGAIIDSDAIVHYVTERLPKRFPLVKQAEVGYDPAFATEVAKRIGERGFTVVEVLQNYKHLSEACQVFEALVKAGRVIHGGHPVLRAHVENVAVKRDDAGRIRPVKPRRQTKRIDGVVGAIMAVSRLITMADEPAAGFGGAWIITPEGIRDAITGDVIDGASE